jgi:hypothetical protein
MKITILLLGAAASMFGQAAGISQADKLFVQAVGASHRAALEKLLDPEFTWTSASGQVLAREQVLRELPQPAVANERDAELKAYEYGALGDVQVNAGRAHVLRVWVKRSDGWKAIVHQELLSLDKAPAFTPGPGKDCQNPCKAIPFTPKSETERQVMRAYLKLETAAHARSSARFGPMAGEEFVAASSNSDRLQTKRSRMAEFDRSKDGGVAPTPFVSGRMLAFGEAVLMISEHKPDRGNPLHVTRIWVKRGGGWMETLSYQTAVSTVTH